MIGELKLTPNVADFPETIPAVIGVITKAANTISSGINRAAGTVMSAGAKVAPAATKGATKVLDNSTRLPEATVTKFMDQGRAMVSSQGFQMTEYYYDRLNSTGRADFATRTLNIINNYASKEPDPSGYPGFYKYTKDDWELIYNPETKEISHLSGN